MMMMMMMIQNPKNASRAVIHSTCKSQPTITTGTTGTPWYCTSTVPVVGLPLWYGRCIVIVPVIPGAVSIACILKTRVFVGGAAGQGRAGM